MAYQGPAAGAGFGDEGLALAILGQHLEGGGRRILAALADDGALVHAQLVQHHR